MVIPCSCSTGETPTTWRKLGRPDDAALVLYQHLMPIDPPRYTTVLMSAPSHLGRAGD